MKDERKHGFSHTHVDIFDDGSATMHHVHEEGPHKDVKYAVGDLDGVHDGLEKHLGEEASEYEKGMSPKEYEEHEGLEEKIHPGIHEEAAKLEKKGE